MRALSIAALSVLVLVGTLTSCQKLKKLFNITFNVPYDKAEFVQGLPGNPVIPPGGLKASIPTFAIPTNSQEVLSDNQSNADLVTSVTLKELKVKMLLPLDQDFGIMDSVWLHVRGEGQSERLIAYKYDIADGSKEISLTPVPSVDLKDIFITDTMYVRVEGHFTEKPDSLSKILFDLKLTVKAGLLN